MKPVANNIPSDSPLAISGSRCGLGNFPPMYICTPYGSLDVLYRVRFSRDPGQGCRGDVTCLPVRLPRSFPGGVAEKRSNPVRLEPLRLPARDQRRYYGHYAKPALPPHGACFCDSDKSSIIPFLANLIGYPDPRSGAPHDSADSECRGCSPLLQSNTQSVHLPQFPNSI
mgnify:FL=1|jgi:hypothetical protein